MTSGPSASPDAAAPPAPTCRRRPRRRRAPAAPRRAGPPARTRPATPATTRARATAWLQCRARPHPALSARTAGPATSRHADTVRPGPDGSTGCAVRDLRRPEFGVACEQSGLGTVGAVQLDQQSRDVALHRGLAQVEPPADLLVGQAVSEA